MARAKPKSDTAATVDKATAADEQKPAAADPVKRVNVVSKYYLRDPYTGTQFRPGVRVEDALLNGWLQAQIDAKLIDEA